ncbi:MAG: ABC transporter ATP-binding protein [Verrucomicrobia bacterium]|nr:ABC transporter ATP-binding protein [Verrucomicrobiota bacterium]
MSAFLQIDGLSKTYAGNPEPALRSMRLHVQRGEFFGLLGPNGAGKTTLISLLCGLLRPDEGSIRLDGHHPTAGRDPTKALFGLVPQEIALYPTLSARENLLFFGRMHGLGGSLLRNRVDTWLERLGLTSAARRAVGRFSGGMKRRCNLIAGLLHEPALVVLDEPTAGVDPQSRLLIYDNLARLNREGMTLLYTTHYIKEAEALCSRVVIIDNGASIAEGTPCELIQAQPGARGLEDVFINLTGRELRD